MKMQFRILFVVLLCSLFTKASGCAFGIKLGHDSTRIASIQSGKGRLEIVSSEEGKRYMPSLIGFRKGLPAFNTDAVSLLSRPGSLVFNSIPETFSPDMFLANSVSTNGSVLKLDDESILRNCDLSTIFFSFLRETVSKHTEKDARDCVITIPVHTSTSTRHAILQSAEASGLRVLSLMEEDAAAALNYASQANVESEQTYFLIDSGLTSTTFSIFTITPNVKADNVEATQVKMVSAKRFEKISGQAVNALILSDVLKSNKIENVEILSAKDQMLLSSEVEKLKKILTTYPTASFTVLLLFLD